jgi:DNA-binding response OmpR family regulator
MKTLIADDDALTRLLLRSALGALGLDVHETSNGQEAWQAWQTGEFPLVISDWMMPHLDGLELCRRIRSENRGQYTYAILLTSRSGKENCFEAMNAGADNFIAKPFEQGEIAAQVRVAQRILGLQADLCAANEELERRVEERTAALVAALGARSLFLTGASHELRTPMHQVLGHAQLLETDALTETQDYSVQQILSNGRHLLDLIDRILAVSDSEPDELTFLEEGMAGRLAVASIAYEN